MFKVIFQYNKSYATIFLGPLCVQLNAQILTMLWILFIFLIVLNSAQIPMQFLYRYLLLNKYANGFNTYVVFGLVKINELMWIRVIRHPTVLNF